MRFADLKVKLLAPQSFGLAPFLLSWRHLVPFLRLAVPAVTILVSSDTNIIVTATHPSHSSTTRHLAPYSRTSTCAVLKGTRAWTPSNVVLLKGHISPAL